MRDLALLDMLKHGVHFGHQQSRRHPKMEPFIFTTRGGISIMNLEKTKSALTQAAGFLRELVAGGGTVMFIGTKRQARDIIRQAAQSTAMPYVTDRWIGGLFTNFSQVRQLIQKLHTLKEDRAAGSWTKYTKKEQLDFQLELERLEKLVGGVSNMERLPDTIFVVDIKHEKTAIHEAHAMKIPVVGLCDSNVNPQGIDIAIPANDDAAKSITYITEVLAEAINEGREMRDQRLAAAVKAAAAEVPAAVATPTE